jgi:predicted AlkP superfamily phosphohydrolase/phosphomutase
VDFWDALGMETGEPDKLASPPSLEPMLVKLSDDAKRRHRIDDLLTRPDRPQATDAYKDPAEIVRRVAPIDAAMNEILVDVLHSDPTIQVAMIHVTGLDNICHALWPYRFPEDFPDRRPSAAEIEEFGPVVDRYLERIDAHIKKAIEAFSSTPNVLIVADHGEGRSHLRMPAPGWHNSPGLFIAAGPDIAHVPTMIQVSYYDIVPTILKLQNFEVPADLRGRPVISHPIRTGPVLDDR